LSVSVALSVIPIYHVANIDNQDYRENDSSYFDTRGGAGCVPEVHGRKPPSGANIPSSNDQADSQYQENNS
jgi:hypothetical protein